MLKKLFKHKLIAGIIFVLVIVGGYFGYKNLFKKEGKTRYVLAVVEKGTLVTSISGSGQVSVSNQLDIKPKTSGDIVYVGVKNGQEIKAGTLIAQLDTREAQKVVHDAQTALETAELELEKLLSPPDELTLLQAENSLIQAKESKQNAENDLKKAYEDGFNTVVNTFLNLPTVMAGLEDMFFKNTIDRTLWNIDWYANQGMGWEYDNNKNDQAIRYRDQVRNAYNEARTRYNENFDHYKSVSRASDSSTIEALILETYETTKLIADAIKTSNDYIGFVQNVMKQRDITVPSIVSTHQSILNTYTATTNSHLSNLLSAQQSIKDSNEAIISAERSIKEKELSLAKLKAGPDNLDIRAKKIAIQQKEDALLTAKQNLTDYFIHSPFAGVVAEMNVKKGDSVSSGTILATLITQQKIAEISLNEVDVAKVKIDQKVTFTFDALPKISITGKVLEVDTLGTVTQGVVSYGVKIVFDTQDERVKPGMSVAADIITDVKQDVLFLPNSAIKSQGDFHYVELVQVPEEMKEQLLSNKSGVILPQAPKSQSVEIGLSNDTSTEIISGLKEGDIVVASTISLNKAQTTQTQRTQEFQIPGMMR